MSIDLHPHQQKALKELKNGSVCTGGVGSGKSITSLAYFFLREAKGGIRLNGVGSKRDFEEPKDLYIITTAKKRDELEWDAELARWGLSQDPSSCFGSIKVKVDSWQNLKKYEAVKDAFFILDEQKLVGYGAWVKAFLKIAKHNNWIMLSATPGDRWIDYMPLFIAHGYFKNKTQFMLDHVVTSNYGGYQKIERYIGEAKLLRLRREILVPMPVERHTKRHIRTKPVGYDVELFNKVSKERWNFLEERPVRQISELFSLMRRVTNQDPSRLEAIKELSEKHPRLIIFYNFTYELEALRTLASELDILIAEWNGEKHQQVPKTDRWLYLVQYTSGAEAWNCITTDAMAFYSLTYSYRALEQSQGRIDRINTRYTDLHYYILRSNSMIDLAIMKALKSKKNFNEKDYLKGQV